MQNDQKDLVANNSDSSDSLSNTDIILLSVKLANQVATHTQLKGQELLKIIQSMQTPNQTKQ